MNTKCKGCDIDLEILAGDSDPYDGSSAACWNLFNQIIAKEACDLEYYKANRMTVDAYMVQHASNTSRAARQSVWVHLAGLYLVLKEGKTADFATKIITKITEEKPEYEWLSEPNSDLYKMTVADVLNAKTATEHYEITQKWATDVWNVWSQHHSKIKEFTKNVIEKM